VKNNYCIDLYDGVHDDKDNDGIPECEDGDDNDGILESEGDDDSEDKGGVLDELDEDKDNYCISN